MAHGAVMLDRAAHGVRPRARRRAESAVALAPWARRLSLALAVVTFLLLSVGGIVTTRDAGMVFPDWPLSNGSLKPDGWLRNADMMSEHGHRILGALTGLIAIALAAVLHRGETRGRIRALGWVALAFVIAQGLLGGLRVTEISGKLALVHGCTGQIFFAITVALVYWTHRAGRDPVEPGPPADRLLRFATGAWLALLGQLLLGADLRHVGGPIDFHALGAAVIAGSVLWTLAIALIEHGGRARVRRPALALAVLIVIQVGLGLTTARALGGTPGSRASVLSLVLPSLHQATGALVLACATWLTLAAWRRRRAPEPATATRRGEPA